MSEIAPLDWSTHSAKHETYCLALGRFIDQFSSVEATMQVTLWSLAKIPPSTGRVLLSGVRTDLAASYIKRLAAAENWPAKRLAPFTELFDHLGPINSLRNDIVHFGALPSATAYLIVTNSFMAITPERVQTIHVNGALLDDMTHDLRKINAHLIMLMYSGEMQDNARQTYQRLLNAAWRYKPAPQSGSRQKPQAQPRKQSRPRQPSRG
jgi:hypothetical protein